MKIAFLSPASVIHTVRWVNSLAERGHEVHLITMHIKKDHIDKRVVLHKLCFSPPFGYYLNMLAVKKILKEIKPDLVNTHYASGYGTLARLSGFHPNILSVWGSDVYDFPYESKWKMDMIQRNLKFADRIASTSEVMKKQTQLLYDPVQDIAVTPFGVDCNRFSPQPRPAGSKIRIGTVKTMKPKYGISYLIEAFAIAMDKGLTNAELILVGGGPQLEEFKNLAQTLNIADSVQFIGDVLHSEVPKWLNSFDIYVALSTLDSESFGVAIVEASACSIPVIVSNVGGLPEVVVQGETGYIVPPKNSQAAAESIVALASDQKLRKDMGDKGRQFVLQNYEWEENVDRMENLYQDVIKEYRG